MKDPCDLEGSTQSTIVRSGHVGMGKTRIKDYEVELYAICREKQEMADEGWVKRERVTGLLVLVKRLVR